MSGLLPLSALFNNLRAPVGTRMPFNQATAPLGWTTDGSANFTDCAIRVNQSTAGATGGSATWSSWYQGGSNNANSFSLVTANLPAHSHTVVDGGHVMGAAGGVLQQSGASSNPYGVPASGSYSSGSITSTSANAANVSVGNTGSGSAITLSFTSPNVKFSDHIIGVKT